MATIQTSCVEGLQEIALNGDPATIELALVLETLAVDPANPLPGELSAASVFADLTEASWTGTTAYARKTVTLPAPVDGVWTITTASEWLTSEATDGPASIPTLAALLPTATRKIFGLWDIAYYLNAGSPIDMSVADARISLLQPYVLFAQTLTVTT